MHWTVGIESGYWRKIYIYFFNEASIIILSDTKRALLRICAICKTLTQSFQLASQLVMSQVNAGAESLPRRRNLPHTVYLKKN